jgi:hypothetical protein
VGRAQARTGSRLRGRAPEAPAPRLPFPGDARGPQLRRRAEAVLARPSGAPIGELDAVLTDACAAVLMLETQCARIERERAAVAAVAAEDPATEVRADELGHRAALLRAEVEGIRALIAALTARRRAYERARRP